MVAETEKLIVGLGNPGERYRDHRHNLGFRVVEELARRRRLEFRLPGALYLAAEDLRWESGVTLLKPLTYMNLSGQAVEAWAHDRQVVVTGQEDEPGIRPLVVCDDLNLPLGSLRLRARGSSGGQNGLASVIEHLGGDVLPRLRLGVAPLEGDLDPAVWPDYVLADFEAAEREAAGELVIRAADAVVCWLEDGQDAAVSRFNRRVKPRGEEQES